jgi:hypothetical protein
VGAGGGERVTTHEAARLEGIRLRLQVEAPHGGVWDDRTVQFLLGEINELVAEVERLREALREIAEWDVTTGYAEVRELARKALAGVSE